MVPFFGQIQLFPYTFAPKDSLLGTTYGGDGRSSFALPDLRGKEPAAHVRYCISLGGDYPRRD